MYALPPNILQRSIWIPTRLIFHYFIHHTILGLENLSGLKTGVVFALNHSSELDAVILPASLPFWSRFLPMFYLSRERKFYQNSGWRRYLYGGLFFKLWGAYTVDAGKKDYAVALKNHITMLNEGKSICIFPEGKVSPDGSVRKGHGGVSYLAWESGHPVVPVAIEGAWHMTLSDFLLRRRTVTIRFGKPFLIADLFATPGRKPEITATHNDFTLAAETVMERISGLLKNKDQVRTS